MPKEDDDQCILVSTINLFSGILEVWALSPVASSRLSTTTQPFLPCDLVLPPSLDGICLKANDYPKTQTSFPLFILTKEELRRMCQRHVSNVDLDLWVVASRLWGYYDLRQASAGFSLRFSVIGLP